MEGILILSKTAGRYMIDDANEGRELSSGMRIEIYFGGLQWISGRVQHIDRLYATPGSATRKPGAPPPSIGGYYFISNFGYTCGLCAGMTVRTVEDNSGEPQ